MTLYYAPDGGGMRGGGAQWVTLEDWEERLRDEVSRARRYGREVAVIVVICSLGEDRRGGVRATIDHSVRGLDCLCWTEQGDLRVLAPETGANAQIPARRLISLIRDAGALDARAGIALCAAAGFDPDQVVTDASRQARDARPGEVGIAPARRVSWRAGYHDVVTCDPSMHRVFALTRDLAGSDVSVLIEGETGVGKEVVAACLHEWSPRAGKPFVAIDCAALPETLLEAELFGYERGAFSGAIKEKPGLLEATAGGTVLLDEIGETTPRTQASLLRVLETRRARRVGSVQERPIDVRVVSATNRDLLAEVEAGRFRRDLFYRLAAARVYVPPLRQRRSEVRLIAQSFLAGAWERMGRAPGRLSPGALAEIDAHEWPGNVRELKNLMEVLVVTAHGDEITAEDVRAAIGPFTRPMGGPAPDPALEIVVDEDLLEPQDFRPIADEIRDLERRRMREALAASGGVQMRAAALIGMPLRTFVTKLGLYGLRDSDG